ncbi:MAG: DUF2071 domain-containing protein [Pirellulaceae bacterium]
MHPALSQIDHRPWEMPRGRWVMRQSWCDLLFAHWPVPKSALDPLVPASLEVQQFDGVSWIGVVPFRMQDVGLRAMPNVPGLSAFPELNVRIYVEHQGRAGVWFLSLDAMNRPAVWTARRFFHLPYYYARMSVRSEGERVVYDSRRVDGDAPLRFAAGYGPTSSPYQAETGTLEHWLTERYCLYAVDPRGRLHTTEIHHIPWPLQRAEAEIDVNEMLRPFDLPLADSAPLLHFARRIDVVNWRSRVVGP